MGTWGEPPALRTTQCPDTRGIRCVDLTGPPIRIGPVWQAGEAQERRSTVHMAKLLLQLRYWCR